MASLELRLNVPPGDDARSETGARASFTGKTIYA